MAKISNVDKAIISSTKKFVRTDYAVSKKLYNFEEKFKKTLDSQEGIFKKDGRIRNILRETGVSGSAKNYYKALASSRTGRMGSFFGLAAAASYGAVSDGPSILESTVFLAPVAMAAGALAFDQSALALDQAFINKGKNTPLFQAARAAKFAMKAPAEWKSKEGMEYAKKFEAESAENKFMQKFSGLIRKEDKLHTRREKDTNFKDRINKFLSETEEGRFNYLTKKLGLEKKEAMATAKMAPTDLVHAAIASDLRLNPDLGASTNVHDIINLAKENAGPSEYMNQFNTLDKLRERAEKDPRFGEELYRRRRDFQNNLTFDPNDVERGTVFKGGRTKSVKDISQRRYIGSTNEKVAELVKNQNSGINKELGEMLGKVDSRIKIRGITGVGTDSIETIEYSFGKKAMRIPVLDKQGRYRSGKFGQNINIANRQLLLSSLADVYQGKTPEIRALDVSIAETLSEYFDPAMASENNAASELFDHLAEIGNQQVDGPNLKYSSKDFRIYKEQGKALVHKEPFRSWRNPLTSSRQLMIKQIESEVRIPSSVKVRDLFDIGDDIAKPGHSTFTSNMTLKLKDMGYINFGSDNKSKSNSVIEESKMLEIDPDAAFGAPGKPATIIRDAKGFKIRRVVDGKILDDPDNIPYLQRRPFASSKLMASDALGDSGVAVRFSAIKESEVALISRELNKHKGYEKSKDGKKRKLDRMSIKNRQFVKDILTGGSGTSPSDEVVDKTLSSIKKLTNMREGINIGEVPEDLYMINERSASAAYYNKDLKPGMTLPDQNWAWSENNKPLTHSFSRGYGGTAIINRIEEIPTRPGKSTHKIFWDELVPLKEAKGGSSVGKQFFGGADNLEFGESEYIFNFINKLRRTEKYSDHLYGGVLEPLMQSSRGAIEAFTLEQTFGKQQNVLGNLATAFNEFYFPKMSKNKKIVMQGEMEKLGIMFTKTKDAQPRLVTDFKDSQADEALEYLIGKAQELVEEPNKYFLKENQGLFSGIDKKKKPLSSFIKVAGITTEWTPWDADVYGQTDIASLSLPQIRSVRRSGMEAVAKELESRFQGPGMLHETNDFRKMLDSFSDPTKKHLGKIKSVMNVLDFNQQGDRPAAWRNLLGAQENFYINLEIADNIYGGQSLKNILGMKDLMLPVPGQRTDYWLSNYLAEGSNSETASLEWADALTSFVDEVQNLSKYGSSKEYVDEAKPRLIKAHNDYLSKLLQLDKDLLVGRGKKIIDSGTNFMGTIKPRDYVNLYALNMDFNKNAAKHIMGVSEEVYEGLSKASGAKYLTATGVRYPAKFGPALLIVADSSLDNSQVGLSESYRSALAADFDSDKFTMNIIESPAGSKEIKDIAFGINETQANITHREQMAARELLSGFGDDIASSEEISFRNKNSAFENIDIESRILGYKRISKADPVDILSKPNKAYVGVFSNLANKMMAAEELLEPERNPYKNLRVQILSDIEQKAISSPAGDIDSIAKDISKAISDVRKGNIKEANELMEKVIDKMELAPIEAIERNYENSIKLQTDDLKRQEVLTRFNSEIKKIKSEFFSPMMKNGKVDKEAIKLYDSGIKAFQVMNKKTKVGTSGSRDNIAEIHKEIRDSFSAQNVLQDSGIMPRNIGRSTSSEETLTAANKAKAMYSGTKHILKNAASSIAESKYYGTVKTGAIISAGAMVAKAVLTSPSEMKEPKYSKRGKELMQSPDLGFASMSGAPMPGVGGGHAHRGAEMRNPRRIDRAGSPINTVPNRYYVNQTNRVPRVRMSGSSDSSSQLQYADSIGEHMSRMQGGAARVNVVHDPMSRRMSKREFQDQMREDLRGGR